MTNLSAARKLGIAARIAGQQVKRSRIYGAVLNGARATLGHFGRVAHQLWLETTGFLFLAFAAVGLVALVREYVAYHAHRGTSGHIVMAAAFSVMFGWFGVSSFWKARSKR
jgi:predicted tellurium resistance membrane protein TerC